MLQTPLTESARARDQAELTVEIWSDVVCPWCYIGKRRFEQALAQFPHRDEVGVIWRSFQLDPQAPARSEGTINEMLARKYGRTLDEAAAMTANVTAQAATVGLQYRMDIARHGNTFDAHRLIHLAASKGLQAAATERLMHAYFGEGLAIGDPESLIPVIAEVGVDPDEARQVLAGDAYAAAVRADLARGASFGITGVPFFVINERYGISGAQPPEVIAGALDQAWRETHPLTVLATDGDAACADGSCAVPERATDG